MPALLGVIWSGLVAAFSWLIRSQVGQWILAILLFFGISFATREAVVEPLIDYVRNYSSGIPSTILAWLGYLHLDRVITIILSAYAAAAAKKVLLTKRSA